MTRKCALLFVLVVFCIIPLAGQEKPYYFMMITDVQLGMYGADKDFVRETANYEFAVATVNRLKPSFVIILGDLVNKAGDAEQIREFKRISAKIDPSITVYNLPGNHDVARQPTPESLEAYRKNFGPDYYSFKAGPVYGIVLNSTLIHSPQKAQDEYEKQLLWLKRELETAKASGAGQVIVFQHHPYFEKDAQEPDGVWNLPLERRQLFLSLLHQYGVRYVFAGHIHKNSMAKDGDLEMTATGPMSMPFGDDGSGLRLAEVTAAGVRTAYYDLGRLPDRLKLK